jgi:anti-anti-sigma factor
LIPVLLTDSFIMLKPRVEVRNEGGVLVAEFWDCLRLDPNPVRDLRQCYEAHVKSKGKPDLVVDLNGVMFAGSASLGGFVALHRLTRQQGGRLVFCEVVEDVREVFRISKLAPMFTFVEDLASALAWLSKHFDSPPEVTNGSPPVAPEPFPATSEPVPAPPRTEGPLSRRRKA